MSTALEELEWRGLVYDHTDGLPELLSREKVTVYNGFDPTSSSLQVGNLLALMGLARLQRYGHSPIALAGGGTGMVGDPSGKAHERQLLSREDVEANVAAIKEQMEPILDFKVRSNPAKIMDNAEWLMKLNLMEFLRDVGKYFTVNYMTAKDSVKRRFQDEEGISYTEFSYMLLQAYDFLHLFLHHGCKLQAGGSDQWGNITAGVELIHKSRGGNAHGLVYPLITTPDGSKLGKTESGTIWLDAKRTTPYRFYQFWYNQDDVLVTQYIKYFTWLNQQQVNELTQAVEDQPEERRAQRVLAQEITRMVHGETALQKAELASEVLFGREIAGLSAAEVMDIFADVPSSNCSKTDLEGEGILLTALLSETTLAGSKGDARRLIQGGGVYLNNHRINDVFAKVRLTDAIDGRFVVLRKGRKEYHLVNVR